MSKTGKSRLSRLLPKFLRGDKSRKNEGGVDSKSPFCFIHFLDDSHHQFQIKGNWKGSLLQEKVCELLSLHEKDYFGLRFIDTSGQTHWLDGNKSLSSQFKGCQTPHKLYFGVKFYSADPCKLREEITRYLFFLQVKQDILQGRLPVTFDEAAELCSYALQSELGDFDHHQHTTGYVSEFCFIPNQTEELERRIAAIHRRLVGLVPLMAEYRYLDKVKWLDMYGVDLHPVMGEGSVEYFLGLTPTGIVVYKNKNKVGNYFWPRISKVTFKGKIFIVKVKDKNNEEHAYAFELPRKTACKHLWKCCVEHHAFFRLNQSQERSSREKRVLRSVSTNRRSGRSERQAMSDNLSRHSSSVVRLPSRRQPRRINSDSRLNSPDNYESQYNRDTGMVTMMMRPEPVRAPRHRSLPELQGQESPRSTKSAPWETNFDYGLYTHGKDSPVSERSNKMREQRNRVLSGSDSESGISQRRKYFPNRRGSDNDSDVSVSRRRRRDIDSDSASDISSRYPASQGNKSNFPVLYPFHDKENRPNGSIPSLHSAPAGEAKQRRRRRRSKSPGKRPPEELKQHFEYGLKDTDGMSTEELKEIPFVKVETKASLFKLKYSPKLRQKVKAAKQKSIGDLDQNRNPVVNRRKSDPLDNDVDRDLSVHSQPILRRGPEEGDSMTHNQSLMGNTRVSRRPHSFYQSQSRNDQTDNSTFPRASYDLISEHSNPHRQNADSDVNMASAVNTDLGVRTSLAVNDNYSESPSERSHQPLRPSQEEFGSSKLSVDNYASPQNSRSPHDSYTVAQSSRSSYSAVPQSSRPSYSNLAVPPHSRSPHGKVAVPQSSRSSHENSKSYHSDYEVPRSRYAASNTSYRSHRLHHDDYVSHAHPSSQGVYDSGNKSGAQNRRDHQQGQNNSSRSNTYRNSGQYSRSHQSDQGEWSRDDQGRTEAEYERLQFPASSDSRMERSRSGERGESRQTPGNYYNHREGSSQQNYYASVRSESPTAPPPYDSRYSGNISHSSMTSPPQTYHHHHHHQQQQPPPQRRSAGTHSSYPSQPSQNYSTSGSAAGHDSMASHNPYDQGQSSRAYGLDEGHRSRSHYREGHRHRESEGERSRFYNQGEGHWPEYRGDSDRPRSSFHEEQPPRSTRSQYQEETQRNQFDHQSSAGYQHSNANYQPHGSSHQYQQPSSQSHHQGTPPRHQGTPPRQQGTPPRYQGTPPRYQGTPPNYQGTPPRQSVSSTPPRHNMDPRYSQGLMSMHAREQSEGSSSQASVLGGGNYHRSPRPSPAAGSSNRSASHNLGNSLTSEQARQFLRSPNYNPDLCTEL